MNYVVVYDISQRWPALWVPAIGLAFVAVGRWLWRNRSGLRPREYSTAFAAFFLVFAVVWTTIVTVTVVGRYIRLRRALSDGTAGLVEGVVEDFEPGSYRLSERFTVAGVHFAYSGRGPFGGFNHISVEGGPIREGLPVRIHYVGPANAATIVKLEIAK